jgi:hypothetical protein
MFDVGCVKLADLPSLIYFVRETYGSQKWRDQLWFWGFFIYFLIKWIVNFIWVIMRHRFTVSFSFSRYFISIDDYKINNCRSSLHLNRFITGDKYVSHQYKHDLIVEKTKNYVHREGILTELSYSYSHFHHRNWKMKRDWISHCI